jgi:hypothetical protein
MAIFDTAQNMYTNNYGLYGMNTMNPTSSSFINNVNGYSPSQQWGSFDYGNGSNNSQGLWSKMGGLAGIGGFLNDLGGFAMKGLGAYTGLQQLGLAKDYLGLAKSEYGTNLGFANRNLANQAQLINNANDFATAQAIGLAGGSWGGQDLSLSQAEQDRIRKESESKRVDGSPIKG